MRVRRQLTGSTLNILDVDHSTLLELSMKRHLHKVHSLAAIFAVVCAALVPAAYAGVEAPAAAAAGVCNHNGQRDCLTITQCVNHHQYYIEWAVYPNTIKSEEYVACGWV
jgi:hypothetical protein